MLEQLYFAQKAFIVQNNKLLLVHKSNDAPYCAGKWEVPGGRMEVGDSIDSHLRREVYEEVGIDISAVELFYMGMVCEQGRKNTAAHCSSCSAFYC